jgi:hypothetical protein
VQIANENQHGNFLVALVALVAVDSLSWGEADGTLGPRSRGESVRKAAVLVMRLRAVLAPRRPLSASFPTAYPWYRALSAAGYDTHKDRFSWRRKCGAAASDARRSAASVSAHGR